LLFSSLITPPIRYSSHYFSPLATLMAFYSSFAVPLVVLVLTGFLKDPTLVYICTIFSTFGLLCFCFCLAYSSTLKSEAVCFFKTSVHFY
jgi:hypothetical protein